MKPTVTHTINLHTDTYFFLSFLFFYNQHKPLSYFSPSAPAEIEALPITWRVAARGEGWGGGVNKTVISVRTQSGTTLS